MNIEIVGIGNGYLQHRRDIAKGFEEQVTSKRRSRAPSTMAEFNQEALDGLYQDENGKPYIPSAHIERCMVDSGTNFQIRGQGKKTYKKEMMSSVVVSPTKIAIKPVDWTVNIQAVKIQGKQTFRARPLFKAGWAASFVVQILDDELQHETVKDILSFAGKRVGIGDYRPKYGQFEVTKCDFKN